MTADRQPERPLAERSAALFGRADVLAMLSALLRAPEGSSELVCVLGEGGVGKTRLLEALAAEAKTAQLLFVPITDFYHIDTFRASALEDGILVALEQYDNAFAALLLPYREARARLDQSRQSGAEFEQAQLLVRGSFIECYDAVAARLAKKNCRILLLFDTVEQAVALSDGADHLLDVAQTDASAGGEHWLRATLPQLKHTLSVLSGRPQTLYGEPVTLYADLGAAMTCHNLALAGLSNEATTELAKDMRARALRSDDVQTAGLAEALDLDDEAKLRAWHELSEGLPFWVAILFTIEQIGNVREEPLALLQEEVERLGPNQTLDPARREQLRTALRDFFLGEITQAAPTPLVVLQCMATMRKGLTLELLGLIMQQLALPGEPSEIFGLVRALAVVKTRTPRRYTRRSEQPGDPDERETLLFLHDELYAWLDTHPIVVHETREMVREAMFAWYLGAIEQAEAERLEAAQALIFLRAGDPQIAEREADRDDAQRRKRQLQRDALAYSDESGAERSARAAAHYQLFAYEAIFGRDAGQETALRQEVLRNLYRHGRQLSSGDMLAFAALWLLRAAVQYEDNELAQKLLERLDQFQAHRCAAVGTDAALFELAIAIARLYSGGATRPAERVLIQAALVAAEQALDAAEVAPKPRSPVELQWLRLLRAQSLNFRGYLHRLNYELAAAIRTYRNSELVARGDLGLLPQFRATTLNNLAFALSEQGDTEEARRIALLALGIRQRHGSAYDVAISRGVLARIGIRTGTPGQALRYAQLSTDTMRAIGSPRGLVQTTPALGEAYRKHAELLDDSPGEQDAAFEDALAVFDEAQRALAGTRRQPSEALREILQNRGCTYRSWGLVLMRRGHAFHERAKQHLSAGHHCLEDAFTVATESHQPPLIRMDILEDLAAIHVNEDEYDHRVDLHLDEAEALADDAYKVHEGTGPQEVTDATRGYWRELGQCQLQRMLTAFGKYDFGAYDFNTESGEHTQRTPPGDKQYFDHAAKHLVFMMAYLVRYNHYSSMLTKARELTLRELLLGRTPAQIDRLQLAAYTTAKSYNLLYDESFVIVEQVISLARDNLGLEG